MTQLAHNSSADRPTILLVELEQRVLFWVTGIVLFGSFLVNQTHIETTDGVKAFAGPELMIRLGVAGVGGLIGLYGVFFLPKVRSAFLSFPAVWVTGIALMLGIATVFSPYRMEAFAHFCTFLCVFLLTPTAFVVLGTRRFVHLAAAALAATLLASWFVYLVFPTYGVVFEATDESGGGLDRMGGTSHPNGLAAVASLAFIFLFYFWIDKKLKARFAIPALVMILLTLLLTNTRVATVAGFASVLLVYRNFWFRRDVLPYSVAICALILGASMFLLGDDSQGLLSDRVFAKISRSGDASEITTLTGREELWRFVIAEIHKSPLVGYGPGSPKVVLKKVDMHLLHTHNVILAMAFSGGYICAFLTIVMFAHQFLIALTGKYRLAALITVLVILNSFTETMIFDYIPGTPTILWLAALFWPVLDDGSFDDNSSPTQENSLTIQ